MDKEWVFKDRMGVEYHDDLCEFISNSIKVAGFNGQIKCPYRTCFNQYWKSPKDVYTHILTEGMYPEYVNAPWKFHGEPLPKANMEKGPSLPDDGMLSMLQDAFGMNISDFEEDNANGPLPHEAPPAYGPLPHEAPPEYAQKFYGLIRDAETELYPGCGRTKLSFIVSLYQLKSLSGWTNSSFTKLLEFLKDWLPEGANVPPTFYHAWKTIIDLGLPYERIDACEKNCVLYYKEHANKTSCPLCGAGRYKKVGATKVAKKVLHYLPLGPRLQRLYMSRHTAKDLIWHAEGRQEDGVLRHPADSPSWKKLDSMYPIFGNEPRNVRLGLASDGFNPFDLMSTGHSTWPVILLVYNLPPWLCMKRPYLMLSLLIPGPKSPGNKIDVFLRPLIDELQSLWDHGLTTYDSFKKETFPLRVAVLWTINDFPAYAMLSGWSTSGKKACLFVWMMLILSGLTAVRKRRL